jgi:hypothetical protein
MGAMTAELLLSIVSARDDEVVAEMARSRRHGL